MLAFSLVAIGVAISLFGIGVAFRVRHGAEAFAYRAHWANSRGADPVESKRWAEQARVDLASAVSLRALSQ